MQHPFVIYDYRYLFSNSVIQQRCVLKSNETSGMLSVW